MINNEINQDEIIKIVWGACDVLRSTTADPFIYKDFILTMLFLKYMSDVHLDLFEQFPVQVDENQQMNDSIMANQPFKIPTGSSFWDLYEVRHEVGNGRRIDQALHAIEEANGTKFKNLFQYIRFDTNELGSEKQKNEILSDLLEYFSKESLNFRSSRAGSLDMIGNVYEYLIKHFAARYSRFSGGIYTPAEVSDLLSILLEPQEGDKICDPTCGLGSLLIKCGKQVQKKFNGSKNYDLYGQEINCSTCSLSKINMLLHGEYNYRIEMGDTIRNPMLRDKDGGLLHFDIVIANPPFSVNKWGHEEAINDPFGRFSRGVPPKTKGDYAFILHMVETLKSQTGRMGVVVPHGVLFRSSAEGKIRKQLIEENLLDTVIGLPEKLFFGTGIPAVILIFKKNKLDDKVLFIDASREYKLDKNQNLLTLDNIKKIVETYKVRKSVDKYSYLATLDEIRDNDYNLNIPRYVDTFEEQAEINLVVVLKERLALQNEQANIEIEIQAYLNGLGYGA